MLLDFSNLPRSLNLPGICAVCDKKDATTYYKEEIDVLYSTI
jgi:hypothetical protein